MKSIFQLIQKLTPKPDKLGHFYWGFIYTLFGFVGFLIFNSIWFLLLPSFILAAAKEYFDAKGYGKAELADFIFTILPSIIITAIIYLI